MVTNLMKKNMNTQLLKKLYNIHSPSGKEQNMIRFLRSYIGTLPGNISVSQDRYGNLYVIKGTGENYPCLVSHIDQVAHCHHSKDFKAIETKDIISAIPRAKDGLRIRGRMTRTEYSSVWNA